MKNAVHKSPNLGIKMSSNQKKTLSKLFLKLNFTKKNDDRKRKKDLFNFTVPYNG